MKKNLLIRAVDVLYVLFVCAIAIVALCSMVSKAFLALVLLFPVLYGIVRTLRGSLVWTEKIPYRRMWWCLFSVGAVLMFIFAWFVRLDKLSWDWGNCIQLAFEHVFTGGLKNDVYFARYPNNQFWYGLLVCLFSVIKGVVPSVDFHSMVLVTVALACLMVLASIALFHHIAFMLWGEKKAFFAGLFLFFCFPLWLWSPFAYTDTSGMLLLMLLLYVWLKLRRAEARGKWICLLAVFGLLGGAAWKLKVTVFIFVIASVLSMLLGAGRTTAKGLVVAILVIALCIGGSKKVLDAGLYRILPIDEKTYEEYEFPMAHWVMMSLQYGGYTQEDVDFTSSFPNYEEKRKANLDEIKKRLKERGVTGCAKLFLIDKQFRTWGDASFAGCEYLSRENHAPGGWLTEVVRADGAANWIFRIWLYLYYGVMVAGMVAGALAALRNTERGGALSAARLTMLGIALLMTLWECNSRYIVLFLPLMALLSCEGYVELRKGLVKEKHGEEDTP